MSILFYICSSYVCSCAINITITYFSFYTCIVVCPAECDIVCILYINNTTLSCEDSYSRFIMIIIIAILGPSQSRTLIIIIIISPIK